MIELLRMARQAAVSEVPVLIGGETGTGKEILANAIHFWSTRASKPFVALNCTALPEALIESELFGHLKGAFSGALSQRLGRFATANGGTLFLDEIGDLPLKAQAKLLRVLQEGTFEPVGADRSVRVDVRIVAATHRDLQVAVQEGRFREDLFYRLNVFPLKLPPLRARPEDLPLIAERFLERLSRERGRGPWQLPARALRELEQHPWPGNIRELINLLERATILKAEGLLELRLESKRERPIQKSSSKELKMISLAENERRHITAVLHAVGFKISGRGGAAEVLGLKATTLHSRMSRLGIDRRALLLQSHQHEISRA